MVRPCVASRGNVFSAPIDLRTRLARTGAARGRWLRTFPIVAGRARPGPSLARVYTVATMEAPPGAIRPSVHRPCRRLPPNRVAPAWRGVDADDALPGMGQGMTPQPVRRSTTQRTGGLASSALNGGWRRRPENARRRAMRTHEGRDKVQADIDAIGSAIMA
jgi:hypothetical protein